MSQKGLQSRGAQQQPVQQQPQKRFSEDGSTLKLNGNISRSNAPGFEIGKQIVVEIKIGFASIASGDAYVNGEIKSLVLHHR